MKYWEYSVFTSYWGIPYKMKMGYSPVVVMVGSPNAGKTALGGLCGEVIHYIIHGQDCKWDPEKNTVFDMNQLSHKFLDARKQVILIAEAGFDLSFDEWQSKVNKFFDKIVTTQRVMGNCYILNIPVAKDLARRHRRKVDYLFDVKFWGYAKIWQMKIKRREMVGNEFGKLYRGGIRGYPLPQCWKALKKLDEENKQRIREELVSDFQEDEIKTKEIKERKKIKYKHSCGWEWIPMVENPKKCPGCQKRLFLEGGKLDVENVKET